MMMQINTTIATNYVFAGFPDIEMKMHLPSNMIKYSFKGKHVLKYFLKQS